MITYLRPKKIRESWIKLLCKELHNSTLSQILYYYPNPVKEHRNSVNMACMGKRYTQDFG
jgi:hypothetical protein